MLLRPQRQLWTPSKPAVIAPSRRKLPDARRRIIPVRAAVVLDSNPGTDQATSTPVTNFSYTGLTIGAGLSNGAAFFGIIWGAVVTAPAATWNNVSCTLIRLDTIPTILSVALFWIPNPASGNHTFAATWTNSAPVAIAGCSFSGVDQVNGAQHSNSNQSTSATSLSQAITTANGNYTMGICGQDTNTPTFNNTAVFADNTGLGGIFAAESINASTGASTTYTATQSILSFVVVSGVDIVAAGAAAAAPIDSPRLLLGVGV